MKRILFSAPFFHTAANGDSVPLFEAGKHYPADDEEAKRCVARGIAKEIDVEDPATETGGPSRADLDKMLGDLPAAIKDGKAPTSADSAIATLRATFGDLVTAADEAAVQEAYKAAAPAATGTASTEITGTTETSNPAAAADPAPAAAAAAGPAAAPAPATGKAKK